MQEGQPSDGEEHRIELELLSRYYETPVTERNWRRDAAFSWLPEPERREELIQEAIRDTGALAETLHAGAISDPEAQRSFLGLLAELEKELHRELDKRP